MNEKKDAQGHQVEASVGRPAEFGTRVVSEMRVTEFYGATGDHGHTSAYAEDGSGGRYLITFDTEHVPFYKLGIGRILRHATVSNRNFVLRAFVPDVPSSSDSVPPLATGSTEASIRAQAMEDCAVMWESVLASAPEGEKIDDVMARFGAAIRAAKEQ